MKPNRCLSCSALLTLWGGLAILFAPSAQALDLHFVTEPFPPYNYLHEGTVRGPMPEMVRMACSRMAITCSIEVMPWRRALQLAGQGKADGIFSVLKTPEREAAFYLGPPLVEVSYALFTRKDLTLRYQRPADLDAYTLAVYGPSGTQRTLEALQAAGGKFEIVQEIDNITVLRKLAAGRYGPRGAALVNRDVAEWLIREESIDNLKIVGELRRLAYHVGLSRRSVGEATAKRFHQALVDLEREGQLRIVLNKYGLQPSGAQ